MDDLIDLVVVGNAVAEASGTNEQKIEALTVVMGILVPLARAEAARTANGEFLKILLALLKDFLPILLQILLGGFTAEE